MTKGQLKALIKECLIEILMESAGGTTSLKEAPTSPHAASASKTRVAPPPTTRVQENRNFKAAVKSTVQAVTSDPIMQSILADTAQTTLQEQNQADRVPTASGGDFAGYEEFDGDSPWASLAFSPSAKK